VALSLRAAQINDLRDACAAAGQADVCEPHGAREITEQCRRHRSGCQEMGFGRVFLCSMPRKSLRIFFSVFDLLLGIFGSLALAVAHTGHRQYFGDGDPRAAAAKSVCSKRSELRQRREAPLFVEPA